MAVGANIPDLAALYDQLKNSMQDADTMINQLDGKLTQANEEWRSKGAHEFNDAWHNGFKPSLTISQTLAKRYQIPHDSFQMAESGCHSSDGGFPTGVLHQEHCAESKHHHRRVHVLRRS